jgi:DNA-directed RNA polymerase specialized sigma24 family protein
MASTTRPQDHQTKDQVNGLWQAGDRAAFCAIVLERLAPKIQRALRAYSGGDLSAEDCEDCFNEALEGLVMPNNPSPLINDAVSYIWRSAFNFANSRLREIGKETTGRQRVRREMQPSVGRRKRAIPPDYAGSQAEWIEIPADAARVLVEELAEVEAEPSVAVRAVRLAVSRLTPAMKQIASHIMVFGKDYNSSDAPTDLGLGADTFRKRKQRLFETLPTLIVDALRELGAEAQAIELTAVFTEPSSIPSDEPD